jgi:hypothetical protein
MESPTLESRNNMDQCLPIQTNIENTPEEQQRPPAVHHFKSIEGIISWTKICLPCEPTISPYQQTVVSISSFSCAISYLKE